MTHQLLHERCILHAMKRIVDCLDEICSTLSLSYLSVPNAYQAVVYSSPHPVVDQNERIHPHPATVLFRILDRFA